MNNSTSNTARSSSFADESCWTETGQPVVYEFRVTEGDPMPAGTGFEASAIETPIIETVAPAPASISGDFTTWSELLEQAIRQPGILSKAYRFFHDYSLGNQLLAIVQCQHRGIEPGPIATFPAWKDKGRFVKKGERALMLCMPITCKDKSDTSGDPATFTRFAYKNRWFVIAQTTPRSLREVEAESVALILCDTLGLSGAEYSRGYIQNWLSDRNEIPAESAQKIFKAADSILKAGQPRKESDQ